MKKIISFLAVLLADIFSLILAFYCAYFIRIDIIPYLFNIENPWFFPIEHFYKMYYLLFFFILIFFYEKLYTRRYDFFEEFVYISRGLFISVIFIAVFIYLSRTFETFSRAIPILMMLTGMIIVPLLRFIVKKILIFSGFYIKYAVVVGKKEQTDLVLPTLKGLESTGYKIADVLEPEAVLAHKNDITTALNVDPVRTLILVSEGLEKEQLNLLINSCENHVEEIKILSDSSYLKTIGVDTEYIEELLVMRMANNLLSPVNLFLKRVFDLVISLTSLILFLPVFLLIGLLVKIDSRGPVLFVQERFGKDGKKFKFLKFRSMFVDGDDKLKSFLKQNPDLQKEWEQFKKLKSRDPRVTRVGKFLRRFSLDESPQIYNVFKGDMSIVGPRPYLIREKEEIQQSAAIIFRVPSGLTGLWQIKGRSELSFDARLKLDEFYVRNWSFFLDIIIILKTFGAVLKGKGAY
ncbi:MAG: exopolysaccharide biosynthesis polyprenyl glycosylphosphotransferase [bacterium]|nr:exopolysaccharide biosynthesis polyprenyl glycosylphosphotransferase [bacterium]